MKTLYRLFEKYDLMVYIKSACNYEMVYHHIEKVFGDDYNYLILIPKNPIDTVLGERLLRRLQSS